MSGGTVMCALPMARRAAREALDAVFLHKLRTEYRLRDRWAIAHREHLAPRPDEVLRVPMTTEAPLHLQRLDLPRQRHLIEPPVAAFASHALLDVDAVVEEHEVGKVVHAHPPHRLVLAEAGADRLEDRRGLPNLRVAVHA